MYKSTKNFICQKQNAPAPGFETRQVPIQYCNWLFFMVIKLSVHRNFSICEANPCKLSRERQPMNIRILSSLNEYSLSEYVFVQIDLINILYKFMVETSKCPKLKQNPLKIGCNINQNSLRWGLTWVWLITNEFCLYVTHFLGHCTYSNIFEYSNMKLNKCTIFEYLKNQYSLATLLLGTCVLRYQPIKIFHDHTYGTL